MIIALEVVKENYTKDVIKLVRGRMRMNNQFPNFRCGECPAWLAYDNDAATLPEIIEKWCKNCSLYPKTKENEDYHRDE